MSKALITHPHVETYIEIIAGYLQPDGRSASVFDLGEPLISLARYDMKIVPSLAKQTLDGLAYTEKQAKLAHDLVIKYERQLTKHGISVETIRQPQYRLPIRSINRTKRVFIEDEHIILQFPFIVELVDQVREYCKISKGCIKFDHTKKYHRADLTEYNLNWIYAFAQQNGFEIDAGVHELMNIILDTEKQGYEINLEIDQDHLTITNAATSMLEYLQDRVGGLQTSNLLRLIDHAPVLGYTVSKDIESAVIQAHGSRFYQLCTNKVLKVEPGYSIDTINDVINYAVLTNRLPVYVYEPDLSLKLLQKISQSVPVDMIYSMDDQHVPPENTHIVYLTKIPKKPCGRIPLLISSAGMLFGGNKTNFLQSSEKVVYFTQDVYNKNIKGMDICKLD